MKNSILNQVLTQEARARLNTLRVAKPEKGQKIEAMLIQMAQTGQLGGRIGEDDLIGLLEKISGTTSKPKVNFDRLRCYSESLSNAARSLSKLTLGLDVVPDIFSNRPIKSSSPMRPPNCPVCAI